MNELLKIIDERIEKYIRKNKVINSKPAIVKTVDNDMATVTVVDTGFTYTLPNRSGTFLNIGDEVQVYYKGNTINERSAYINVSHNCSVVCSSTEFDINNAKDNILYFIYDENE